MKKIIFLLSLIFMVSVFYVPLLGNVEITSSKSGDCDPTEVIVGNVSASNGNYLPVLRYYINSYGQYIYDESDLGEAGTIVSLALYDADAGAFNANNITLWLGNTTKSEFASATAGEFVPVAQMQQVFHGTVTGTTGAGWLTIEFTTPFEYTGEKLVVAIHSSQSPYLSPGTRFYNTATGTAHKTIQTYSDTNTIDPANPVVYGSGYIHYLYRPDMKFNICVGVGGGECQPITNLFGEYVPDCNMLLTWEDTGKKSGKSFADLFSAGAQTDSKPVMQRMQEGSQMRREGTQTMKSEIPVSLRNTRAPLDRSKKSNAPVTPISIPGKGPDDVAYFVDMAFILKTCHLPLNNPAGTTTYGPAQTSLPLITGGDWVDGEWYCVNTDNSNIYKVNTETGVFQVVAQHAMPDNALGMAYYEAEDIAYVNINNNTLGDFYTVNLNTGATQYAFTSELPLLTFTITNDGRFIGFAFSGNRLVEVNPTTGACTTLVNLTFSPNYVQDMSMDRQENVVYWGAFDGGAMESRLYRFDPSDNQLTNLGVITDGSGDPMEVCGLAIPTVSNSAIAAKPTNFTVTPQGTQLKANCTWTNPTTTVAGDPLTSITKMVIKRNGVQVHEITSGVTPGGNMNWTDNAVPNAGNHCYSVFAVTSEGDGVSAGDCGIFGDVCVAEVNITSVLWGDDFNWTLTDDATGVVLAGAGYLAPGGNGVSTGTVQVLLTGDATFDLWQGGMNFGDNAVELNITVDGEVVYTLSVDPIPIGYTNTAPVLCAGGGGTLYNIYRDGDLIGTSGGATFTDYGTDFNTSLEHTWSVSKNCPDGEETELVSITVDYCTGCYAVTNLQAEYVSGPYGTNCEAVLTWQTLGGGGLMPGSLATPQTSNNGSGAVAFDVIAGDQDVTITAIETPFSTAGAATVHVYYKAGTACGNAANASVWTLLGQQNVTITVVGNGNNTYFELPAPLTIPAGQTYGLYIATIGPSGTPGGIRYLTGASTCAATTVATNSALTIMGGHGITTPPAPFGGTVFSERNFCGTIHYSTGGGGDFSIYRDGEYLASATTSTYTDDTFDSFDSHTWCVVTECEGGITSAEKCVSLDPCKVAGDCDAPEQLTVEYDFDCTVNLDWTPDGGATLLCEATTIGTGTTGSNAYPLNTFYNYSYTQLIYDAADLGASGTITTLAFQYFYATAQTGKVNQTIYLANTDKAAFAGSTDWVPISQFQQVFTGTIAYNNTNSGYWVTITLDEPFEYTGGNLVIAYLNSSGTYNTGSNATFYQHPTTAYKVMNYRTDGAAINPAAPPTASASTDLIRPNLRFDICRPVKYNVYRDGELIALEHAGTTMTDYMQDPYAGHEWCVAEICSNGWESELTCASMPFCANADPCSDVVVGNGTANNYTVPANNLWNYSYVQEIFDASEVSAIAGDLITGLSFEYQHTAACTKSLTIYMGMTTQSTFTSDPWIPVTDLQQVFTGTVTFSNANPWAVIEFQEPFLYTGDNIVIAINNTSGNYPGSAYTFRTHTATGKTRSMNKDTSPAYDPANLTATGSVLAYRNNVLFRSCTTVENDMAALAIAGMSNPVADVSYPYIVTVKNNGVATESDYLVKVLTSNNVVLAQVQGPAIAPGETKEVTLMVPFTESMIGPLCIKGGVVLEGDVNPVNNSTSPFCFTVRPYSEDDIIDIPADPWVGTAVNSIPFQFYYYNGGAQSVYLNSDMGIAGGIIKSLSWFYNNTGSAISNYPVRVYLANSGVNTLGGAWLPESEFTLVYEGNVSVPTGLYQLTVDLEPENWFLYTGQSLVVTTERMYMSPYVSGVNAFTTGVSPAGRTMQYQNDGTPFGWNGGSSMSTISNLELVVQRLPYGVVTGTVTDCLTGAPLAGVSITDEIYGITVYTDADGNYTIPFLPAGESYNLLGVQYLYYDVNVGPIAVEAGGEYVYDFCMTLRDKYIAYGVVQAADGTYIEDATLSLSGYADYGPVTSGVNGTFEFLDVMWATDYTLTVTADGYQKYTGMFDILDHTNLGTIILYDITVAPGCVEATEVGDNAEITWCAPEAGGSSCIYRYDNGVRDAQLGFQNGDQNAVVGSAHRVPTTLTSMSWYLSGDATSGGAPHAAVCLWILDLDASGNPTANVLFSKIGQPNVDEAWNTYEFETPVECPNGFFIGVSSSGVGFVGVGTDSGTDPEWPFVPNTHYYSSPFTSGTFSTFESSGFTVTPMLRAEGSCGKSFGYIPTEPIAAQGPQPVYIKSETPVYGGDPYTQVRNTSKGILGYKLWRLLPGQEDKPELWSTLTNTPLPATEYTDYTWQTLSAGTYKWAVSTVYHGLVESKAAFSNSLVKVSYADYVVNVTTNSNDIPTGAVVTLGTHTATVAINQVIFPQVAYGTYSLKVTLPGYQDYTAQVTIDGPGLSHTATLIEIIKAPFNLQTEVAECNILFSWQHDSGKSLMYFDIYLDGELRAEGISGTNYLFTGLPIGEYEAGVAAHYSSGNSAIVTTPFLVTCSSVDDIEGFYHIYPNPTSEYLTIERTNLQFATIDIYNAMGMHIATYETSDTQFDISVTNLAAGTYFIRVTEGSNSSVKSFVKKQ